MNINPIGRQPSIVAKKAPARVTLAIAATLLTACGAKTGLENPRLVDESCPGLESRRLCTDIPLVPFERTFPHDTDSPFTITMQVEGCPSPFISSRVSFTNTGTLYSEGRLDLNTGRFTFDINGTHNVVIPGDQNYSRGVWGGLGYTAELLMSRGHSDRNLNLIDQCSNEQ